MRKFLRTSHVISRVFLYVCVIGVLLLYFFKPGVIGLAQKLLPDTDSGAWLALVTTLSIAAVMFAASELSYKSLTDNEFMILLSSEVLKPAYGRYDLSDKRFSKPEKGEFDFNASLRDVTDEKERVMRELAWERQNSKKLQKKTVGNKIVTLFFFIAGLVFFFYPILFYPITHRLLSFSAGSLMDYFSIVALILAVVIIFEIGNNQGQARRFNTILSIRNRSDDLSEKPALPAVKPEPAYSSPAPVYEAPKPAASVSPVESAPAPAEPVRPEAAWKPEPEWTGVPADNDEDKPQGSAFVNLTPEESSED